MVIFLRDSECFFWSIPETFSARKNLGLIKFKILTYEVSSSTDWANNNKPGKFSPNYFIKVSKIDLKKKVEALKCYKTEMRKWPHTRSISAIKNLSKLRGSSVGLEYAESFHLFRQIDF